MLEARSVTKRYATVPAVSDVNFTIKPSHVLGYLGPNGSGKSTTVKMLAGLLEPSAGIVLFRGEDIRKDLASYKRHLGYVPEEANLYPYLSGREYLELVGQLRGLEQVWLGKRSTNISGCYRFTLAGVEARILAHPALIVTFVLSIAALVAFLRRREAAAPAGPIFDDKGEPQFALLHLSGD